MSAPPESQPSSGLAAGLFANPYLLLVLTTAMWGGHSVVSRLAVGEISPASLTCLRWLIVASIMFSVSGRGLREHWPVLKPRLGYLVLMGTMGYTAYNTLLYWSAHTTTAINIGIINAAMPAMIFIGALMVFGQPVRLLQWIGMLVSMIGVVVTAAKGDFATLLSLTINRGDILILIATVLYAGYSVLLRNRPLVPSLVFFAALAPAAAISSIILLGAEIVAGEFFLPSWKGWLVLLYVAIFPSLLSQIFFIRAVELIGAGRAGLFTNLMPLFSTAFAMLILGEELALYHVVALVLVLGGILLAEWKRP
ncbi:MAG: DMT family transporter [Ferrovibrio sp.]|uniref:DMT family transporter n=1 Tax=Ferrovibrio sp. TaxID=1917215 RepID=UPI002614C5A1|nr:DMT family transporter [Ferrovibrio sp.]MCW0235108.1 DMT family transporter [Ferrovibrio sp.]